MLLFEGLLSTGILKQIIKSLFLFLQLESINLALQILHESTVRGHTISVERVGT